MVVTFISEEDLARHSNDGRYVAEKAEEYIRGLRAEVETAKAAADASSITAEQTCSLLEQKFLSLSAELADLQSQNAQLQSTLDHHLAEEADVLSQKHQLHLQSIAKDGEIERLMTEVSELNKSKRQLLQLVERKDLEISEKNATINSYVDRIVNLTDTGARKEARLSEVEVELARSHGTCARLTQEKELIERHNAWLNDELTAKLDSLIELRRIHAELQEDMSVKLSEADRRFNESSNSLKWNKERVKEFEAKLILLQEELSMSKDAAAANEERFSAELSTVNKLVELYKESSDEWSRKAGELEGVIKALETRMHQVENDYKQKLEKEVSLRKELEKETADLKEKLEKCEAEVENRRKDNELGLLPIISFAGEKLMDTFDTNKGIEDNGMVVPKIPVGVSGTALAASLLRDGWSLAKMYAKYQEAVDALRHEQLGRKESEAVLQRVLCELEEKAGVILDERAEYERMVESYSLINQKLQLSIDEKASLEKTIQELKVDLKRHGREYTLAQKEIVDLQKQVTILLKECCDIQLRCGNTGIGQAADNAVIAATEMDVESDAEKVISENLLTFRDINGLVEQNVHLRSLVRSLSEQIENKEIEFKEQLELELRKHAKEAESKVAAVLNRAEEQGRMIESLHASVGMYKRLYEEEHNLHSSSSHPPNSSPAENGRMDLLLLLEGSQEASKKVQEKAAERMRSLEEELAKSRSDIISLRSERDKLVLDAKFARERLDSFVKEYEHQRNEMNGVSARNVELSHLLVEYQRKLRENSESLHVSEELSRKLNMEISVLKHEKEMLSNAEKRACDEVRSLSERVYRLQATLDTVHSAEEVREEARAAERRKQEEYIKQLEREWAEAKKEIQQERDNVRALTSDRENTLKNAMRQVEGMRNDLANALNAVMAAESRATIAETKLSDLEKKIKNSTMKVAGADDAGMPSSFSTTEVVTDLLMAKEEIEKLKEEARANKEHMLQYKNIAQVNEEALKQIEVAHEAFKIESERLKESLEAELQSLRNKVSDLEGELISKSKEATVAATGKDEALASALGEVASSREECSRKSSQILLLETQVSALREDLEKERDRCRTVQNNYERQVILQSETIQELTRTSQTLALLQQEASNLRNLVDALKSENNELKAKWDEEKLMMETSKVEAEKKYEELNEQNKILLGRLEALHIQLAEKQRSSAAIPSGSTAADPFYDGGLQNVINFLRRSKEIGEMEISLLKQEKLRLQSQLESALKAAENAQASLHAERASSRAILFSEEEIKSLQLQVGEMNLLRESNAQLREENKHNFEECQKLREMVQKVQAQSGSLETLLREREIEIEACKKEIEMERLKKDHLEKRVSELLEMSKSIDMDEYNQMKDDLRQMRENLKEKDAKMQEIENGGFKMQETISRLEQDLGKSKAELHQKEKSINEILQTEASLRTDLEKQKKLLLQWKKKSDSLSKEKDEISEEKQALSKQIEELRQGKRSIGNVGGEQVMKEKEEKEHRIQILEKTMERQREELRKEKEDHRRETAMRQFFLESFKDGQMQTKVEQHKLALEGLSGELSEGNLPEDIPGLPLCRAVLEDLAVYSSLVERIRNMIVPGGNAVVDTSTPDAFAAVASVPSQATTIPSVGPTTSYLSAKATDDKDTRPPVSKTIVEARRTGRKLVRPKLVKPEEPQGDIEMSEADGRKLASSQESEMQHSATVSSLQMARKRLASSASDLNEQLLNEGDSNLDMGAPVQKRPKGSDLHQEGVAGLSVTDSETKVNLPAVEESCDTEGDLTQLSNEEGAAEKGEAETAPDKAGPPTERKTSGGTDLVEAQNESNEFKPSASELYLEDDPKDQGVVDNQQSAMGYESDREEGELVPDVAEVEEGGDLSSMTESLETGEEMPELGTTPLASPAGLDDEIVVAAAVKDSGEASTTEVFKDEKSKGGDLVDPTEGSNQLTDGNDQNKMESDQVPAAPSALVESTTTANAEADASRQVGLTATETEEVKQVSPASNSSTVVNLAERAKERAMLRQSGAAVLPPPATRGARGRGIRGRTARIARGGRSGRGPSPGQQGY